MELKEYAVLPKAELLSRIKTAKAKRNAIILAHNYVRDEVQRAADILGDSLGLSRQAAATDADTIVFCGVMFMAETAKILAPEKTVLIPDRAAGCPLAAGATMEDVLAMRRKYPDHAFVAYVNTTAEVKAVVDVCCTSANAVEVVASFGDRPVVFLPDRNLGAYVQHELDKKNMILWDGGCYVHHFITIEDIKIARAANPDARIIVHPECPPEVTMAADVVASTGGMFRWVAEHDEPALLGTEIGMVERLNREFPQKSIGWVKRSAICSNMKLMTLSKLARSMEEGIYEVEIDEAIRTDAEGSIRRMIEIG